MEVLQAILRPLNIIIGGLFGQEFWLTRFVFMRALGIIYFVAFLGVLNQYKGLFGQQGLLPAHLFLERVGGNFSNAFNAFWKLPTVFWLHVSDSMMGVFALVGVILSLAVVFGVSNGAIMLILWVLYMSFVHIGQTFYGYGWESMLLETGFLAIFLVPFLGFGWFPANHPPPKLVIFLLIWVLCRNMLGSGLIKLRGDSCWRDLTCLFYHFETQPLPNPMSTWFHHLPKWMLKGGVLFNHFVELIVPFGLLLTAPFRIVAGAFMALFQMMLIVSGNLSWLNWLTLVLCIPCFDDRIWRRVLPTSLFSKIPAESQFALYSVVNQWVLIGLGVMIAVLSIKPIKNLMSSRQMMNTSYEPFHIVNSYGAFGGVGKQRFELILSGANNPSSPVWQEYEFKAKPGNIRRAHPIIAPYQPRLDWQIWFAAMGSYQQNPWLVHMVYKLLKNDANVMSLIRHNPFPKDPPRYIKIDLYEYKFPHRGGSPNHRWERRFIRSYLPPLSVDNDGLLKYIKSNGWAI